MQRIEIQHHTPEQVRGCIEDALVIVDEAKVPVELREVAFVEAVRLLAAKTVQAVAHPQGLLTPGLT